MLSRHALLACIKLCLIVPDPKKVTKLKSGAPICGFPILYSSYCIPNSKCSIIETMSKLTLSLLGPFHATINEQRVTNFPTDKIRALLAYLAVEADKPHRRSALATLLWPEYSDSVALRNLRQSFHRLRQTFDKVDATLTPVLFTTTRQTLMLNSEALILDVYKFQQRLNVVAAHDHTTLHDCESCLTKLQDVITDASGEFLQGFSVEGAIGFDEWQTMRREQFHQQRAETLRQLIGTHEQRQEYGVMHGFAAQLLTLEPWREDVHQWAMRALALNGQRSEALAQYEQCSAVLATELGVAPTDTTTELYEQIRRGELTPVNLPIVNAPAPPTKVKVTELAGFPQSHAKFLGRTEELTELTTYLTDEDCRLVTLIGSGGSGKTRLATEVAKRYLRHTEHFTAGIFFVSLTSITDPTLLAATIATQLGLQLHEQASHQAQLIDFLRTKQTLLVLDNFEQVVDGATVLGEILEECVDVKVLATSRVALNLRREQRFAVGGLRFPANMSQPTLASPEMPEDLLEQSAVQLFIQAARQVQPGFTPEDETLVAIAQICAMVQGMPLALELAATWVRLADCVTIANEIRTNLDFLSTTTRDMPERHRSMRAVFAESWQLIAENERRALAQLSIFAGGFTLEALLAVTDGSVVDLANLLDWSLIERGNTQRYGVHELLRQFAEAELVAWPAANQDKQEESTTLVTLTRQRHSNYFLTLVEKEAEALHGDQPQRALQTLRRDLDNIRAAWRWAVESNNRDALDLAADGLADFFFLEGLLLEGEQLFATAVAQIKQIIGRNPDTAHQTVHGHLLVQQANFLNHQGMLTQAQPLLEEALGYLTTDGDHEPDARLAQAQNALGDLLRIRGEYNAALGYLETALNQYEHLHHRRGQAQVLNNIGQLYWSKSEYGQALSYHQRALQLDRQLGNQLGIALHLSSMGLVYYRQSIYAQALDCHQQALAVAKTFNNRHDMAKHLSNMGVVYYDQGNFDEATVCLERALLIDRELGNRLGIAKRLTNLGMIHMRTGYYREALTSTQEAHQWVLAMEHQSGIALTQGNIGVILWQMGEYEQALAHHQAALALDETLGNQDAVARHLGNIGATQAKLGNLVQAIQEYDRALALHQTLNTRYHWAQTLLRKAEVLYLLEEHEEARTYQRKGLQMAREINRTDSIFEGELLGSKLALSRGERAQALEQLTAMLQRAGSEQERAILHDQLWQVTQDPFHAQRSRSLYEQLLEKSPSVEYRQRIAVLTDHLT